MTHSRHARLLALESRMRRAPKLSRGPRLADIQARAKKFLADRCGFERQIADLLTGRSHA